MPSDVGLPATVMPLCARALVINLDSRPDKLASAEAQVRRVGLHPERLRALTPDEARQRLPDASIEGGNLGLNGTFDLALELVAAADDDWVLVVEDDLRIAGRQPREALLRVLGAAPEDVGLVWLGYMVGNEWRRDKSFVANVHRLARPRARVQALRRSDRAVLEHTGRFHPGSHITAIRPVHADAVRAALEPYELPLDHLLHRAMLQPDRLVARAGRSLGGQRAFASDIAPSR